MELLARHNSMGTFPSKLEFQIHRSDGEISNFLADSASSARNIFDQIQRGKVFTQPSLILADTNALMVYPGTAVVRIDLLVDAGAQDLHALDFIRDGAQRLEITHERWQAQTDALIQRQSTRRDLLGHEGDFVTTFGQIQMASGDSICMEYQLNLPSIVEQRRFFQVVFSLPGFSFTCLGGGISILNPTQIVSCIFHPGGEPPTTAWHARRVATLRTRR